MQLTPAFRFDARSLTLALAWLRLCSVAGQTLTVLLVVLARGIALPEIPLFAAIATYSLIAFVILLRLRSLLPVGEAEATGHLALDVAALTALLYFSGGATNPFITLLLVPIALSAAALSWPCITLVTAFGITAYLLLMRWYIPLPGVHAMHDAGFALHLTGMAVNFLIAALLLAMVVGRLASALRTQQLSMQKERERALRNQGVLAIATQAAGAAHELNTPLSSLRVLLGELVRERAHDAPLQEDLRLLAGQVERCRLALRDMVATGREQLDTTPQRMTLESFVQESVHRFHLLQPEIELEVSMLPEQVRTTLDVAPDVRHALLSLLHNAADASLQVGSNKITLIARVDRGDLRLIVSDQGAGLPEDALRDASLGQSRKRYGLGLGLVLTQVTAERLRGDLRALSAEHGSALQLRIPIAVCNDAS